MRFSERQLNNLITAFDYSVGRDVDEFGIFWIATDDRGKTLRPIRHYRSNNDALLACAVEIGDLILCNYFYGKEISPNDKLMALQVYYQSQGYEG